MSLREVRDEAISGEKLWYGCEYFSQKQALIRARERKYNECEQGFNIPGLCLIGHCGILRG